MPLRLAIPFLALAMLLGWSVGGIQAEAKWRTWTGQHVAWDTKGDAK